MKAGAFDYVTKPVEREPLLEAVSKALERRAEVNASALFDRANGAPPTLTYGDPAMSGTLVAINRVAKAMSSVLVLGETGAGKDEQPVNESGSMKTSRPRPLFGHLRTSLGHVRDSGTQLRSFFAGFFLVR